MSSILPIGFMEKAIETEVRRRVEECVKVETEAAAERVEKVMREAIAGIVLAIHSSYRVETLANEIVITVRDHRIKP
jgi:hypothetical protein